MALKARQEQQDLFQHGAYIPITVEGRFKDCIIAFARKHQNQWGIIAVPRFLTALVKEGEYPLGEDIWKDTYLLLPEGIPSKWIDSITGELINSERPLRVGTILQHFPVSLIRGL